MLTAYFLDHLKGLQCLLQTVLTVFCAPLPSLTAVEPGIFILNFACRDMVLRESVLERVKASFPTTLSKKIEEDVNEVLLCSRREPERSDAASASPSLNQAAKSLQSALCSDRTGTGSRPHLDIAELLSDLRVI